ncbi:hypothetical protein AtubIFM54640_008297 [Aspergillus tubingensis]|nr:hypothetical protein AtubIFM54640_008297 [Aspergillus tubingensis]
MLKTATYFTPNFTLHDPERLAKRYIVNNTLSGRQKVKCFCIGCGCTIYTIPATNGDEEIVVRTALIENGLELFKPTIECYVRNRPSYFSATTTGKQYDLMP